MPPKKKEKLPLSEGHKKRTAFSRGRAHGGVKVIISNSGGLFASFDQRVEPNFKTKKAPKTRQKVFFDSPNVTNVHISSDEEDAGQFKIPDAAEDEEEVIKKMNTDLDVDDVSSFAIFNNNGEQVDIVNGKHVIHENQPPPALRPGIHEELIGNYPKMNEPAVKKVFTKKEAQKRNVPIKKPVPKVVQASLTFHKSLCDAFQADRNRKAFLQKQATPVSFRVFNTPRKNTINKVPIIKSPEPVAPEINSLSIIINSPNQEKSFERNLAELSYADFAPGTHMVSTPIENRIQSKIKRSFPIFNNSSEEEPEKHREERESNGKRLEPNQERTIQNISTSIEDQSTLKNTEEEKKESESCEDDVFKPTLDHDEIIPSDQLYPENEEGPVATSFMNRKAETSVTELLDIAEREECLEPNQEDSKYSKKRQRTKSPETMCQGMSTVMTMGNDENEIEMTMEMEKENEVKKRGTLQPQQRQLVKESRMSRLSVVSTASSCHDSINSAMSEMSLNIPDEDTMGYDLGKSNASESRAESRNAPTGMTIHNDDESILPFYLNNGSFVEVPSVLNQLLHVAGQTEIQTWGSLPKSAFDGRRVKKLGEGSYGEVFATNWDGRKVAIKVVPFEEDKDNRIFKGEYHSGEMQTADELLPEIIVLKELNELKTMELTDSTPNFIEMVSARIVKGNYPNGLLKAWDNYEKESENTRPNEYSSKDQLFCVLVSANGGIALEDFRLQNEHEFFSILHQLILSMVAAEAVLEFEHRDLHLGNVLIDRSGVQELKYKISNHEIVLKTNGVQVNIIDFTLSRISKEGTTVYLDLEHDPAIFDGHGDPQFDVYREMRKNCKGNWKKFNNKTNLMWIIFIANRLLEPDICPEGLLTEKRKKELSQLITELGTYSSCRESFVDTAFYEKFYQIYFGAVAKPQEATDLSIDE